MQIIDTNIVLRYILDDHPELSERARNIIDKEIVTVPIEVLCEVVFVLSSVYKVARKDISVELKGFLSETLCEVPYRDAITRALEIFAERSIDFVDCVLVGYKECEGAEVYTFDHKLKKLLVKTNPAEEIFGNTE